MDISEAFKLLKAGKIVRHKLWKHAICLKLDVFHNVVDVFVSKWILGIKEEIVPLFLVDEMPYAIIGCFKPKPTQNHIKAILDLIANRCEHVVLLNKVFELHPRDFNDDGWEVIE